VMVFKLPCQFPQLTPQEQADQRARCDNSVDYIKRLIGLPGDTIQMKQGRLYINDKMVPREATDFCRDPDDPRGAAYQHYVETLPNGVKHCIIQLGDDRLFANTEPFHVPAGHYFMMGDNRDNSADSRDPGSGVGYVPAENLIGHAQIIFFSTNGYADWWRSGAGRSPSGTTVSSTSSGNGGTSLRRRPDGASRPRIQSARPVARGADASE